jgi:hypothetical protein
VVRLAEEEGAWKMDRLLGFARFDRAGFERAYRRRLVRFEAPQSAIECVLGATRRLPTQRLEAILLNPSRQTFGTILVRCDRAGVERSLLTAATDPKTGFSKAEIGWLRASPNRRRKPGQSLRGKNAARLAELSRAFLEPGPDGISFFFLRQTERMFPTSSRLN